MCISNGEDVPTVTELKPCLCAFDECERNKRAPAWAHKRIAELESELAARIALSNSWAEAATNAKAENEKLSGALEKIRKVTQFDHPKSQIIGSEEYEGAWLDCIQIAQEVLTSIRREWPEVVK